MYDINKRKSYNDIKVEDMINILKDLPQDAKFHICGVNMFTVHVEKDDSIICIDTELLSDCYSQ